MYKYAIQMVDVDHTIHLGSNQEKMGWDTWWYTRSHEGHYIHIAHHL